MYNDAWSWEEVHDQTTDRHGFCGSNEQATVSFTIDLSKASGVWYQKIEFHEGAVAALDRERKDQQIDHTRSVPVSVVLAYIPKDWWPIVVDLTGRCVDTATDRWNTARDKVVHDIDHHKPVGESSQKHGLETQTQSLRDLTARHKALQEVVAGYRSPFAVDPQDKPKPAARMITGEFS